MASTTAPTPSINDSNHGPQIILAGGTMLSATVLMVTISSYNRWHAKTLFHVDSILLFVGATLDVLFLALFALMVHRGFGRHFEALASHDVEYLRKLFLGTLLVFFVAHGAVKMSYNLLARRTSRSKGFHLVIDAFSGFIVLWTVSNIIVTILYLSTHLEPTRSFFLASGSISVVIVGGQLMAFLWIIWRTQARLSQKIQWSLCMIAFVPLCIAAIVCRLVYTPVSLFAGDWTFDDVTNGILFLIDLNMVTVTVLAPNLPVFFAKTSTGGLNFMPNETLTARSRSNADSFKLKKSNNTARSQSLGGGLPYTGGRNSLLETTISHTIDRERANTIGSDVIILRQSGEVWDGDDEDAHNKSETTLPSTIRAVDVRFDQQEQLSS